MIERRAARRRILKHALAACSAVLLAAGAHRAGAQKSSKTAVLYQDHPHDGRRCSECKHFATAGETNTGTCAIVDGPVDRDGWCMAFSPRS